ncbi:hypothetical protein BJY04DRAFT_178404 [Aspergillus karnatakaensis]|uniref:uncharacterized protein n=1 Tax=Aspergillus karnatakaensis TaxID=1810916 RepID=UPI003CCD82D1
MRRHRRAHLLRRTQEPPIRLRRYSIRNYDSCGLVIGSTPNECVSIDSGVEMISGGSVVGIAMTPKATGREPIKHVTADTWFYRNGTARYTLAIDSDEGREFDALHGNRDAQVEFIVRVGKITEVGASDQL